MSTRSSEYKHRVPQAKGSNGDASMRSTSASPSDTAGNSRVVYTVDSDSDEGSGEEGV